MRVLGTAEVRASNTVALLRRGATVSADSPLSGERSVYIRSKSASEGIARELQRSGVPVVVLTRLDTRYDDSRTREELGIHPRDLAETYRDALR